MKITNLKIENFLAIGTADLNLADRGLVLIEGVNERNSAADSNGSGKSSIVDALCWAFYGVTARGITGDSVINRDAGKQCSVTVAIEDGELVYTIARHRKHKTGKNGLTVWVFEKGIRSPGKDLTLGTDKLTQEVVDKILGCSYDVFKSSIYAGQEQLPDLPAMTDKQLKILVEEAAGVTILEEAYGEALKRVKTVKDESAAGETRLASLLLQIENERDRISFDIQTLIEDFEKDRKEKIERYTAHARVRAEEAKGFQDEITKANKPAIEKAIAECDAAIAGVAGELRQDRENEAEVLASLETVRSCEREVAHFKERVEKIAKSLVSVEHEVGCLCGECGREITVAEVAPRKAKLVEAQSENAAKLKTSESGLEYARKQLASVTDKRDAFRATMTDISATSAQRASLLKELAGIALLEKGRDEAVKATKEFVAAVNGHKTQANPHHETLAKAKERVAKLEAEMATVKAEVDEKQKVIKIAELAAKVFSPAGVRAHILDDVTPFLNDRTAKYLAALTDGAISATWQTLVKTAKGELREKFSIEVTSESDGESFAAISGGEKRKVRLSAALALQDLVARRASKPIELFIGDEIDDALDAAGRERLMGVLDEKARERGSVFIVSHTDLKDWISQVITVTKPKTGGSVIEEVSA